MDSAFQRSQANVTSELKMLLGAVEKGKIIPLKFLLALEVLRWVTTAEERHGGREAPP